MRCYHGTATEFDNFEAGTGEHTDGVDENVESGVFLAMNKSDADYYAERAAGHNGGEPRVLVCEIREGVRLLDYEEIAEVINDADAELTEYLEDNGYDGVIFTNGGDVNTPGTILILDPADVRIVG